MIYNKGNFSFEDFKKIFEDLFSKPKPRERRVKIYTNINGLDLFDAYMQGDTDKIGIIEERIRVAQERRHINTYNELIDKYGAEVVNQLEWLQNIVYHYTEYSFHHISYYWSLGCKHYEDYPDYSDDGYTLEFREGKYLLKEYIGGGYVDTEIIKELNFEEVKKLVEIYVEKKSIQEQAEALKKNSSKEEE